MTKLDVGEFYHMLDLGYFVCHQSVSGWTLMFALCFIWPRRRDEGFEEGAIRVRGLEMKGMKTKETIICWGLSQKPLESQCHLQLHYWTIWEVVQFRGLFFKLGFFADFPRFFLCIINFAGRISGAAMFWVGDAQRLGLRVKEPK